MSRRKVQEPETETPETKEPETETPEPVKEPESPDGPTQVKPIPPPPDPDAPIKKKRGRPPGCGNKKPGAVPTAKAIVGLADVKKQLVIFSATASGMARGKKWSKLADSLAWHKEIEIFDEKAQAKVPAFAPSDRLDLAVDLMGPYMDESGMLSAASLSNEGKMAIGLCILLGPTVVAGFGMLAQWAFKRPAAKDATIAVRKSAPCDGNAACAEVDGILRHVQECPRHPMRADPSAERN